MSCPHCEHIRAQQREIMERFGVDSLPRWGERPDIDAELRHSASGAIGNCACDCHAPARLVGTLPRLAAA